MFFGEIDAQPHRFLLYAESSKKNMQKNLEAILLFVDFSKAFDFIDRGKLEQILLAHMIPL